MNKTTFPKLTILRAIRVLIVTMLCFTGAWLWNTYIPKSPVVSASSQSKNDEQTSLSRYKHTRIADIQVGERVVVSEDKSEKPTSVDPLTWKKLTLYAEETWYDGTKDTINVETLVPPDYMSLNNAQIGSLIPIPLDVEEMGLDKGMLVKITAISPCPEIRAGPGRVVLTTVNHLSRGVCELTYQDHNGQQETINPTGAHRFYSLDRQEWIHIQDSRQGERLQGLGTGVITVLCCKLLGTTERVYNMTVEEDHVYHVGQLNLLAHNTKCELFEEEFDNPADAIGDLEGEARLVGKGRTHTPEIYAAGYKETRYYRDSNNVKHTVFYNHKTKMYGGGHVSTGQEYD
ncbi:MAG: polymorphic toxin-type HINT domain-containing protein [Lachnospiraceae bacterium]|nr:polymorphic toxin-type HINT domain-containing protein [Lachnospiraceae bacterium]